MMKNWKRDLKDQLLLMAANALINKAMDYIPNKISLNLDPVKGYLEGKEDKPKVQNLINVTGKAYRKQVIVFEDPQYNRSQY